MDNISRVTHGLKRRVLICNNDTSGRGRRPSLLTVGLLGPYAAESILDSGLYYGFNKMKGSISPSLIVS